jgi:hypothetical protein
MGDPPQDLAPKPSFLKRFLTWWRPTKPSDAFGLVFTALSVVISVLAFMKATQTAEDQQDTQHRQATFEREQSAPVLAPGTPLQQRGQTIKVFTDYREVRKRADRLLLNRQLGHFVVPMRNGGAGIALTVGLPLLVQDCLLEPVVLPSEKTVGLLGTYLIPSGGSDQLAYFQPKGPKYQTGSVDVGGTKLWYSWDYANFGRKPKPASRNLLLWYTDGARRRLRWTCTTYQPAKATEDGQQYAVSSQIYGSKEFPSDADTIGQ